MNRKQFARGAKVVVDVCKGHGTWFDAGELPVVVEFVMNGGLERAEQKEIADQREKLRGERAEARASRRDSSSTAGDVADGGGALIDLLLSIF
jgi:hypothetical protein